MNSRILIADDSLIDCQLVALALNLSGGLRADIGRSCADIDTRLRRRQYDLIILDYHLDEGVAEPILRLTECRQRRARVLMVSGDAQLASRAHQLSPRVDAFVAKGPGFVQAILAHINGADAPLRRSRPHRGTRHVATSVAPSMPSLIAGFGLLPQRRVLTMVPQPSFRGS